MIRELLQTSPGYIKNEDKKATKSFAQLFVVLVSFQIPRESHLQGMTIAVSFQTIVTCGKSMTITASFQTIVTCTI